MSGLSFDGKTPVAPKGLGGLPRDLFGNGRLFVTVSAHGGLTDIAYWNRQHLGAAHFLHGDAESPWVKCFRAYAEISGERQYLTLNDTSLLPFGHSGHCEVDGVGFEHQMLLLPDAVVQRFKVLKNPKKKPVGIATLHQESCTATTRANRTWTDFEFIPKINAMIASCTDVNPPRRDKGESLAQQGFDVTVKDGLECTTWLGIGCDAPLKYHRGYHKRSKHYLSSSATKSGEGALFLVFAKSRKELEYRLKQLSKSVHKECDALLANYKKSLAARPQIKTGDKILDSAFAQYPECIDAIKIPDTPGAIKATLAGYFIWGWDGLTAPIAFDLANDSASAAENLRFYQRTMDKDFGIPHAFTTDFTVNHKGPFPSQAQFIADLYHYVSTTGDLSLAKELMPTCKFILEKSRKDIVKGTSLVKAYALWPDFPEAMEETGDDISSMNNSLLYQGLRSMEYLALALGDKKLADDCREWAKKLRSDFVKCLYDSEKGFFISSCDSKTLKPRKHYCPQSIFWITPFARELASHAPQRIADFMERELRSDKCLLTLPHWDTAWMADGNQLGSTFPAADHFYLNINKIVAKDSAIDAWTDDISWFWKKHTAPEAYTPEAGNEAEIGVDNPGCKQLQALTTWYVGLFAGIAGLDFDHEGVTLTPWGKMPLSIKQLKLRGVSIDLEIKGSGRHVGSLKLNGKELSKGSRKIAWSQLKGKKAKIELVRTDKASDRPSIIRADGISVEVVESGKGLLRAKAAGGISGELIIAAAASAKILVDGKSFKAKYCKDLKAFTVPFVQGSEIEITVKG